ncbi:glycosyltransferase family 2 protein [Aquamicrobium soli]|jgi:hypothetical protein|uniref:Glycosyltransferase family 2 protein n=1 Tax=Aquamicrobium soli TaxID=1811518 RepID=A0ABV7KEX5_9HYPH
MTDTVISLSSIPPRFGGLFPTLTSLLRQELPAREIRLNIPRAYRRFPNWDGRLPEVPAGITIHRCQEDLGPATKVLPTAKDLRGHDVDILFCDDDKIYDPDWHARFKAQARLRPNTCIVEAGETFPDIADTHRHPDRLPRATRRQKGLGYRLFRIATLGLIKPGQYRNSGYVDQISAWSGVLVRPDWFSDAAFDIPDILWTVDDPWLSGHLEMSGIPIWLNARSKQVASTDAGTIYALLKHVEDGHGRVEADLAAISYFRSRWNIWKKAGPVAQLNGMTTSMKALSLAGQEP